MNIENEIKILINLFNASKFDLVITKGKKILKKNSEYIILYNIVGSAYLNTGRYGLAKELFLKAIKMDPSNIAIMNNLANTYKNLEEIELAEQLYTKIIDKQPDYINAYVNFGNLKRDMNDFKKAIELYNKALKINEKIPLVQYSLALAHQGLGDFKIADNYAKKVLSLDPTFTQADLLISQSNRYTEKNNHFKMMNEKKDKLNLNLNQKSNLYYGLAKANEDLGNIETSFKNFDKANKIIRSLINFKIEDEIQLFNSIKREFNNVDFDKFDKKIDSEKKIIFILGMPRSGTTLVEQIISSHSNVFGGGELPFMSQIIEKYILENMELSPNNFSNLLNSNSKLNEMRSNYLQRLTRFSYHENFITDKAPLNFRWIGFIKILFPNSKIIHCTRNAKDNCLSLYKNFFEGGLNFTYNQKELGDYYNLYLDLMNYWKKKYPNSIYDAKYEKILDNQELKSKEIINFCGLNWESQCLKFHKNKTPIKTMSTAQARKPIYNTSVNSYKKYSSFLTELNKII